MYPYDSLTVITPIVFFVLLVLFPVIGLFAGWKRAAYWGGGNLLFYIIGLIIWKTAGMSICHAFTNLLVAIAGQQILQLDFNLLLNSVISPLFFLIVILAGNLILVICYYTFAKRLIKIGKYDPYKHPELNKPKDGSKQVQVKSTSGKTHVANTKWFNRTVGAVGLTALMLPITLTTTHLTTMATTTTETRQKNSFTNGMYNGLQALSEKMSWFSYYRGDETGRDIDGLFSVLSLYAEIITYKNIEGKEEANNVLMAVTDTISKGLDRLANLTLDPGVTIETKEKAQPIVAALNSLIDSWNSIIDTCTQDLEIIFDSPGIIYLIKELLCTSSGTIKITDKGYEICYGNDNSIFNAIKKAYLDTKLVTLDGEVTKINQIEINIRISQDTFDLLVDTVYGMFDVTNLSAENQVNLKNQIEIELNLLFVIK